MLDMSMAFPSFWLVAHGSLVGWQWRSLGWLFQFLDPTLSGTMGLRVASTGCIVSAVRASCPRGVGVLAICVMTLLPVLNPAVGRAAGGCASARTSAARIHASSGCFGSWPRC